MPVDAWWHHRSRFRDERASDGGERDRSGDRCTRDDQRDVDRPVEPPPFAELVRAIERVDDPHAFGVETQAIVEAFLAEHGIIGPGLVEMFHQELVRPGVARVHDLPGAGPRIEELSA